MNLSEIRERMLINMLRWAPKGTFSDLVGFGAGRQLPRRLRAPIYTSFAKRVGADLSEVEKPLEEYPSLNAFFTRRLKSGLRTITAGEGVVVSPCDGTISENGLAGHGELIQAKGRRYTLHGLLGDRAAAAKFTGGTYLVIYLAPRDYHRVHFAAEGKITGFQHIPGALFPVNAVAVRHVGGLFTRNERLITYQDTPVGEVASIMVGATAVGRISVTYDAVETHARGKGRPGARVRFAAPRSVERGAELGTFHLGSTVILLFEPGRVSLAPLELGQKVRLGELIARRAGSAAGDAAA